MMPLTLFARIQTFLPLVLATLVPFPTQAAQVMENLDRGLAGIRQSDHSVFLSWRMLNSDSSETAFNVYRSIDEEQPVRINQDPIDEVTWLVDSNAPATSDLSWFLRPVIEGMERTSSKPFSLPEESEVRPFLSVPLKTPEGYRPNDASVGDLDGDGEYEIILHQAGRGQDNSRSGMTDPPILQAYKLDGTFLWEINLGINIREGAHYTQFLVFDLDGDGRAEVACKTADGTVDGTGKTIGDPNADWRSRSRRTEGKILKGPEFLTVFDGETGAALATTDYIPGRHPETQNPTPEQLEDIWGDDYGNRSDRFLACVAYLDGQLPSLVFCRGYYTRSVLAAWNWRGGTLQQVWTFDSDDGTPGNRAYRGQGNHNLSVADVDGDGRDEIIYGAAVIDDDGTGLHSTGYGHGDALHVADLDPGKPGMEIFNIQERFDNAGANFRNAETGETYWKKPSIRAGRDGEGPGRGAAFDIDPTHPGHECWVKGGGIRGLFNSRGELISEREPRSCNMGIWWDGDPLRELLDGVRVTQWDWRQFQEMPLFDAGDFGVVSNNGSKSNPSLCADILGDWREEIVARTRDNQELRIFISTEPTSIRMPTLMHDPVYRLGIAWQNVAYNQPAHTSVPVVERAR